MTKINSCIKSSFVPLNRMKTLLASTVLICGVVTPGLLLHAHAQEEPAPSAQDKPLAAPEQTPTPEAVAINDAEPVRDFSKFAISAEKSVVPVSYEKIAGFMNSHSALEKNRVSLNYAAMRSGGASGLARILQTMREVPVSQLSRDDQLAYWLNMRNLLVVFSVSLEGKSSIETERGTYEYPGEMWTNGVITVEGMKLSIDDIERHILIANWKDPDILYGMYQGTKGGPPLYKPGFTGRNVHDVLNKLGQRYINSRKTLGAKSTTLKVPAIYEWYYEALFDSDEAKVERHIKSLALPKLAKKLKKYDTIEPVEFSYKVESIDKLPRARTSSAPVPRAAPQPSRGAQPRRSGS